jgi:ABC-type uncharacterized transport system permease subunit
MHFLTALMFSTLIMSMILIIIDGFSTDSHSLYNNNNNNNYNNSIDVMRDARVELLKVKRGQGDGPTILAYIIIAAAIIVPNIPQID